MKKTIYLSSLVTLFIFMIFTAPVAAKSVQVLQMSIVNQKGKTLVEAPFNQSTRIRFAEGGTIAVISSFIKSSREYKVVISSAPVDGDMKKLRITDFTPFKTLMLKPGGSASVRFANHTLIEFSLPSGQMIDMYTGQNQPQDCTCCVFCSNGTQICGCKVRSSCGNCG